MDSTVVDSVLVAVNTAAEQLRGDGLPALATTVLLALVSRVVVFWKAAICRFPQWGPRISAFLFAFGNQGLLQGQTGFDLVGASLWQGLAIVGGWEVVLRWFVGSGVPGEDNSGAGGFIKNILLPFTRRIGLGAIAALVAFGFVAGPAIAEDSKPLVSAERIAGVVGVQGAMYGANDIETGSAGLFGSGIESLLGFSYSAGSELSLVALWDQNYGDNPFAMLRGGGRLLLLPGDRVDVFVGADYVRYEGNFAVYGIHAQDSWLAVVRIAWAAIKDDSDRTIIFARLGFDYDEPNDNHYFVKGALTYQFLGGKP